MKTTEHTAGNKVFVMLDGKLVGHVTQTARAHWSHSVFPEPKKRHESHDDAVTRVTAVAALYDDATPVSMRRQANPPNAKRSHKSSSAKPKARRQHEFCAVISGPGRKKNPAKKFWSASDANALTYCNGLLKSKLPKGARVSSLKRTGKTRLKK